MIKIDSKMYQKAAFSCDTLPKAHDEMTKEKFDAEMAVGLAEAKAGKAAPIYEVFDRIIGELANG